VGKDCQFFELIITAPNSKVRKSFPPYFEEFYDGLKVRDSLFGSALLVSLDGEQMGLYIGSYWVFRRKAVCLKGTISNDKPIWYRHIIRTNLRQVPCFAHSCCKQGGVKIQNKSTCCNQRKEGTNRPEVIVIAIDIDPVLAKWLYVRRNSTARKVPTSSIDDSVSLAPLSVKI